MITRCVTALLILSIIASFTQTHAQSSCMKNCLRTFLKCARIYDSGCCDSYVPCMRDFCKAKFFPCEQQISAESNIKRGSWNKREDSNEDSEFYSMLMGHLKQ